MQNFDYQLDTRGLNCPLPILKIKKALKQVDTGNVIQMFSSDPGSVKDMESFCNQTGHSLLSSEQQSGDYVYMVRKN
ncbi:MAG: sulfurtransferase TusA family protein [Alphaproteobacteria bacterium]